ncbi:MAG: hypothetical protein AB1512_18380 [Thermodesulfobacteriota bacterium]
MADYSPHELALMEKMSPRHRELVTRLTPAERKSLAETVSLDKIELIQSCIGTDGQIEDMLFWDRGAKFDDPVWQVLKPVDGETAALHEAAKAHYARLRAEAVESQRRSDLTLYSQFNPGLLFTGLAGAVRCDSTGRPDDTGEFFRGIEWRCIGSVEADVNTVSVYPRSTGDFEVRYGSLLNGEPQGLSVYSGDSYSLLQLAQLSQKVLPKQGFETRVTDGQGKAVDLDAHAIRRAAGEGERLAYPREMRLFASLRVQGMEKALEAADALSFRFYERYGLETECSKIGKKYGNFFILRDDNFEDFLPQTPGTDKGLVLLTATLVCRRCRREIRDFRDFAKSHPHIRLVLVNLASPQSKFYEKVFADMGGGDAAAFRKTAAGVTPFIIVYTTGEDGKLRYREYIATGKAEAPPSLLQSQPLLEKYFVRSSLDSYGSNVRISFSLSPGASMRSRVPPEP